MTNIRRAEFWRDLAAVAIAAAASWSCGHSGDQASTLTDSVRRGAQVESHFDVVLEFPSGYSNDIVLLHG
jgi:hypothetical protein